MFRMIFWYRRVCTICEFGQNKQFYSLRGLCSDSRHDRVFTWERTETGKPFLKGLSFSTITWVLPYLRDDNLMIITVLTT